MTGDSLADILQEVCAVARELTLAHEACIGMVNEDRTAVTRFLTSGVTPDAVYVVDPSMLQGRLLDPILRNGKPVRLANRDGRPETLGLPSTHPLLHSYLGVPIASASRVHGWLGLRNKRGADSFHDADERVAIMIGKHAGSACESALLIQNLQSQLEARLNTGRRLQTTIDRTDLALCAARVGVWDLDLRTDQLTWTAAMSSVFGLDASRVPKTGQDFFDLVASDDRPALAAASRTAIESRSELAVEFRTTGADGKLRWVYGRAHVQLDSDQTPVRLLGVGIDVTDRVSVEAQLRQAQKLEAVGQLAAGVAHDFNNILTAILGYSSLLADSFEPGDVRLADLEEITNGGRRAAALTRQLLAFSRKQVIDATVLDVNTLIRSMCPMLSRLIGESIELVTLLPAGAGAVRADPGQLEQVLLNLVVNARDAMPNGGRLTIETANVNLDEADVISHQPIRPGRHVMIAVSDNGIGMDDATKLRLFEPFFTTKPTGKGTGLGLATAYGIVQQSGGHIWASSEPGLGATFKIYLPLAASDTAADVGTKQATSGGTERVLVVEDEAAVRSLTRALLERAGYRVVVAPNPEQAEALFRQDADGFDLLLTDVIMPGSSGPRLFERLSQLSPPLKVLYCSGYTNDAIVHQGQLESGVMFVQKPFTADMLLRKVREALNR